MNGFSIRFYYAPEVEVGSCDLQVPVMLGDDPGLPELAEGWRFQAQTARDDALFEQYWFRDFRARWRVALAEARDIFRARMSEL